MKRTRHSKEIKIQVIKEAMETGKTSVVARRYELNPHMVTGWVRKYKDGKYGDIVVATVLGKFRRGTFRNNKPIHMTGMIKILPPKDTTLVSEEIIPLYDEKGSEVGYIYDLV